MNQDDQLPPSPTKIRPKDFDTDLSTLPPLTARAEGSDVMTLSSHSEYHGSLDSDPMEQSSLAKFFERIAPASGWTPQLVITAIFVGSFILSVLFTSAILAGIIEIHPAVIKGFFKSILGKS
jgi:hypothetical protein